MANKELCRQVADRIRQTPDMFDMSTWGTQLYEDGEVCGTLACMAGHTLMASGYRLNVDRGAISYKKIGAATIECNFATRAADLLEINNDTVFYNTTWTEQQATKFLDLLADGWTESMAHTLADSMIA